MPNLQQIIALRKKYASQQQIKDAFNTEFDKLEKHFEYETIEKAFASEHFNSLMEHVNPREEYFSITKEKQTSSIIKYFEQQKEENVVLLFIDITHFSYKTQEASSKKITSLLNNYYQQLMPIIYKYGGEIEKIMGDGVICIFGEPFLKSIRIEEKFIKAEKCAVEIIRTFKDTFYEVKIALHDGPIMYYKTPSEYYEEYTMIGNTLTELYRLESISQSNGINYFMGRGYDKLTTKVTCINKNYWRFTSGKYLLPGIGLKTVKSLIRI